MVCLKRPTFQTNHLKGASLLKLCFVQEGQLFKTNFLKVLAFPKYVLAKKVHFQINPLKVLAFSKYVLSKKASFSNKSFKGANLLTICFVQAGQLSSKAKTKSDQQQKTKKQFFFFLRISSQSAPMILFLLFNPLA